ncbi:hypothetical protein CKN82_06430 [Carnobacterium divergens]|uniref:ABC transporter permease n=2 Tax=Carnobacterium divergens TaxID=2748 RepID=A0A0R2HZU8_CARDV|nr:putative ABC transporter permease [Carnobacterium divergens]AOA00779.1 hypothetical protein BFC22_12085 [Carnobacterium divergens]KRN57998.1 hypothetical protein IV74_GL001256 [Carnobacterium divergens DSM 20623]MDO0874626.1 putative ABC transporter permease [Carnobacterium divergens]MDT1957062.1 putative ABC transporter permease [Carnobacterium divergens]MDT1973032.1 putative ABC transporter permease [Carnobacterium divergens]
MAVSFPQIMLLFFVYAVIGWLWETVYCSLKARKFVYRGFLIGPYCPIYGFGVLAVLYFIEPYQKNIIFLYVMSAIVVTVLEYVTSYGLEKIFHTTWWDYKDVPFNINGRVAIPISLFWGLGCVVIVKWIQPLVMKIVNYLITDFGNSLPLILFGLLFIDFCYSVASMNAFQKEVAKISEELESKKAEISEGISELKVEAKQKLSTNHLRFNQKRMLNSYRKINMPEIKYFKEIKELQNQKKPTKKTSN